MFPKLQRTHLEKKDGKIYEVSTYEKWVEISVEDIDEKIANLQSKIPELETMKSEIAALG